MYEIKWTKEEIGMIVLASVAFLTGFIVTLAVVAVIAWGLGFTDPTYMRYDEAVCQAYEIVLEEKSKEEITVEEAKTLTWLCVEDRVKATFIIELIDLFTDIKEDLSENQ